MNGKIMNSQTSSKQMKAQSKKGMAESAESICALKRPLKTKNIKSLFAMFPAISSQVVARKSLGLSTHRASNILRRTGYHV